MKREEYKLFVAATLEVLDNIGKDERYGTARGIAEDLLNDAENAIFADEIVREAEFAEYKRLQAKFEVVQSVKDH